MKKIELSEDFFAAPNPEDPAGKPADQGTMEVLLGRPQTLRAKAQPRNRTAPPPSRPAPSTPGIVTLLTLPLEITRSMLTVMVYMLRASIPNIRRR